MGGGGGCVHSLIMLGSARQLAQPPASMPHLGGLSSWRQTLPAGVGGRGSGELPAVLLPAAALLRELRADPARGGAAAPDRSHPQPPELDGGAPGGGAWHSGVLPPQPHHQVGTWGQESLRVVWASRATGARRWVSISPEGHACCTPEWSRPTQPLFFQWLE